MRSQSLRIASILLSALVVCGLLGTLVVAVNWSSLTGPDEDNGGYVDPNADLISDQETVVAQHPDDIDEVLLLANLYGNTGKPQQAIALYQQAIDARPDDMSIRLNMARTLQDNDLLQDAEVQFRIVIKNEPDNQSAHYYLGRLYLSWNPPRTREAMDEFQRAVDIDPKSSLGEQAQNQLDSANQTTPVASPGVFGP